MPSYQQLLDTATSQLSDCTSTPRIDAEVLLQDALHKDLAWLIAHNNDIASNDEAAKFNRFVAARKSGKPIAYITGHKWFWRFSLEVNESVLIPRPDTELLVELALGKIAKNKFLQIADLGTGSGAIALAIALERPDSMIIATDQSDAALSVARRNQQHLLNTYTDLQNIQFIQSNWFDNLNTQKFDFILSNPPYIHPQDEHLSNTDIRFEPKSALVSEQAGLKDLIHLIDNAIDHLNADGWLILEHGFDQADAVVRQMQGKGYRFVSNHKDLNGIERVTHGQKPA